MDIAENKGSLFIVYVLDGASSYPFGDPYSTLTAASYNPVQ